MMAIRVFIADDHELVRFALKTMLEAEEDIDVVGEAADSVSAIDGALETEADVLVLDLRMPGVGGVEVCRKVHARKPETKILILTSFDDDDDLFSVLSAGASGYLLKDTRPDRLPHVIRSIAAGQAVFDSNVASRVINGQAARAAIVMDEPLSEREAEVLQLMAKGMSNKEIGQSLWIGETTVKTHVSHILRKLGQPDRTQAVLEAVRVGLVQIES